jgi:GNAT superfamily N-acetyltransferase
MKLETMMNEKELLICETMRRCLEKTEVYRPEHEVYARDHDSGISLAYRASEGIPIGNTRFDIQLCQGLCYILYIQRDRKDSGKGYGRQMYLAIEDFCRRTKHNTISLTSSGEKRKEFWKSLGFVQKEELTFEKKVNEAGI